MMHSLEIDILVAVLASFGILFLVDQVQARIRAAKSARRAAKARADILARWANRQKGKVIIVTRSTENLPQTVGKFRRVVFTLDDAFVMVELVGNIPAVYNGPDGLPVYGGFTEAELEEIISRPGEF